MAARFLVTEATESPRTGRSTDYLAIVFHLWSRNARRKRLIGRPTPAHWPERLADRLWYWDHLSESQRRRLLGLIAIFLHEKEVVVPKGARDPDAARLTVAGAACLLLVGFTDTYCFDRIRTVILNLRPFRQRLPDSPIEGLFGDLFASGAYSTNMPVVLAWKDVRAECADPGLGRNVVIHEFAHHIDDLDGAVAGDPPFPSKALIEQWRTVSHREYDRAAERRAAGVPSVIDAYGLTDYVEFFAVSCEAFYCDPVGLANEHGDLFDLLRALFRIDPRPWFARDPMVDLRPDNR
ncbi:MAG: zinc-dependent peptidase [Planctomycetes bacterium]|nr:zinc-dependent peptidase [Planctomycetota bacterium]